MAHDGCTAALGGLRSLFQQRLFWNVTNKRRPPQESASVKGHFVPRKPVRPVFQRLALIIHVRYDRAARSARLRPRARLQGLGGAGGLALMRVEARYSLVTPPSRGCRRHGIAPARCARHVGENARREGRCETAQSPCHQQRTAPRRPATLRVLGQASALLFLGSLRCGFPASGNSLPGMRPLRWSSA